MNDSSGLHGAASVRSSLAEVCAQYRKTGMRIRVGARIR